MRKPAIYIDSRVKYGVWGFASILLCAIPASAQTTVGMASVSPVQFNGSLANLPQTPVGLTAAEESVKRNEYKGPPNTKTSQVVPVPSSLAVVTGAPMPSPAQNFPGLSFTDAVTGGTAGGGWPPDTNGDVGPNHYIESVNTAFAIYNKTGTLLASFKENSLWSGVGSTPCNGHSQGDPVVLYDQLADHWFLTNFAFPTDVNGVPISPFYECIAVSKTGDPVGGGWYLYALRMDPGGAGLPPVSTLNDYPKFGIWPDCLYMTANEFSFPSQAFAGTTAASINRTQLEAGATVTWALGYINNTSDPFTMIPSNLLGKSAGSQPPSGTPNYLVSESQSAFAFEVRKFTAGASCGGGGTIGAPINVSQTSYWVPNGDIVPQPNTAVMLDSLEDRLMQKVQYRKVGTAESLFVVHSVQTNSASPVVPQWAQINVTGGTVNATPVQQQIYTPDSSLYRWMGAIAADGLGSVALAYSTSNGSSPNFPSIAYSGRLSTDPLNTLPQTETQLIAGAGSQTLVLNGSSVKRWGDYSSLSVDPSDDCTFWYTNEYYSSQANGTSGNWQTRIGSFRFPYCGAASGLILKSPNGGQCARITLSNAGTLVKTAIPCPN